MTRKGEPKPTHFTTVPIIAVPRGRRGTHSDMVNRILNDLHELEEGSALRIPLAGLGETKLANVRSALNRATRREKMEISTSTDAHHLYVWWNNRNRSNSKAAR